jgi:hypothetical protein
MTGAALARSGDQLLSGLSPESIAQVIPNRTNKMVPLTEVAVLSVSC